MVQVGLQKENEWVQTGSFDALRSTSGTILDLSATAATITTATVTTEIATTISGTSERLSQNLTFGAGSQYGIVMPFTTYGVVSGGNLVQVSGGKVAIVAALATECLGVALTTTGSNTTTNVLVYGRYGLTAADTVSAGDRAIVGSTAHLVQSGAVSAAAFGTVINGAASGGTALVLVGRI